MSASLSRSGGQALADPPAEAADPSPRPERSGRRRLAAIGRESIPLVALLVLVVVWEAVVQIFDVDPYTLPAPTAIAKATVDNWSEVWPNLKTTLQETGGGFLLGTVVSLLVGLLVTFFPLAKRVVMPYMVIIQAAPKIALGPILVIWFGFGLKTNIIFCALICFFPIMVNFIAGLEDVHEDEMRIMRSYDASRWQVFSHVQIYRSAPYLFTGLKLGVVLAVIGAVVAEFIQGGSGMGYYMVQMLNYAKTTEAFVAVSLLTVISVVLYWAFDILQAVLTPWQASRRLPNE
jgi:NitT/TauT family transport system permease protein